VTFGAVVRDDEADEGGLLLPSRDVDGGGVAKADRVAHRLADHLDVADGSALTRSSLSQARPDRPW
jgi:hypothetical protein